MRRQCSDVLFKIWMGYQNLKNSLFFKLNNFKRYWAWPFGWTFVSIMCYELCNPTTGSFCIIEGTLSGNDKPLSTNLFFFLLHEWGCWPFSQAFPAPKFPSIESTQRQHANPREQEQTKFGLVNWQCSTNRKTVTMHLLFTSVLMNAIDSQLLALSFYWPVPLILLSDHCTGNLAHG